MRSMAAAAFRPAPCILGALIASTCVVALATTTSGQTGAPPAEAPVPSPAEGGVEGPGATKADRPAPTPAEEAKKPEKPKRGFRLTPYLTVSGEVELESTFRGNSDLDRSVADNRWFLEPKFTLDLSFDPHPSFQTFVSLELSRELPLEEEGESEKRVTTLNLEKAFILLRDVPIEGLALQVGRQDFEDPRQWLYDQELDAVRVHYRAGGFSFEVSASRENLYRRDLLRKEETARINNYHGVARGAITPKAGVAAYVLAQDDLSPDNESPIFLGLHSSGEITRGLGYWLELAHVTGWSGDRKISGFGADAGFTYEFDLPLRPSLILGYAFGSGDKDPGDDTERSFRQTGFHDNEAKLTGVTDFKYYGASFDPELSNLHIFTAGIGIRPTRNSSIELVYHRYLQHRASDSIRDSGLSADPTGLSRSLGSELDLLIGIEEIRNLDIKVELGYFMPGRAFLLNDDSLFAFVEIKYKF